MTDPIADMLTRIRNAHSIRAKTVEIPHSRVKEAIAKSMLSTNYISGYKITKEQFPMISIELKYLNGKPVITCLKRISKPGRRLYAPAHKLPTSLGGYGCLIITTSQGIMTDRQARAQNTGGEILCEIY